MEHATDSELSAWLRFKNGDMNAFAGIYNGNIKNLLRYGYKICGSEDALKDTIQDLFAELWNSRERLTTPSSVKLYLFKSLRYKLLRQEKQILKTVHESKDEINTFELNIEAKIIEKEQTEQYVMQLHSAFDKLTKRQQEAIQLRFYEDFTNEQIAELMQIN